MKWKLYQESRVVKMFSPHGHGMSCFHCDNCHCGFGVDCLDVVSEDEMICPRCGSDDTTWTAERITGNTSREWYFVEHYEKEKS
ncbi:hypothetical protein NV379_02095 [Paenibacillus sp. N1-5-1-14]|uniref:hypothetical protein n=1 Tax=Paenibacillus radicibacter TaxID=2972488 RepID=UPI00215918AF|nr:hypothetical protein [Paenibacillus radicibacter]MCR8641437.1 hypothetical protein [Paenibacillus radicibacter]